MSAAQGLQLGMAFREQQMAKQKLAAEQRNVLSEEIDTRLQETAKQMQAAAKEMAAVRYSSPEEKKAEIEAQWNKQAGPIGASALQLYREAMRAGIKTQGDYENAKQILMIAAKLPDLKAQETVAGGMKQAEKRGEVTGTAEGQLGTAGSAYDLREQQQELERIRVQGEQARLTKAVPSTENINTRDLGTVATNKLETEVLNSSDRAARLKDLRTTISSNPIYLQLGGKTAANLLNKADKMGIPIGEAGEKFLTEQTQFVRDAIENINNYIKEITGAQMSEREANRLRLAQPDPGEDILGGDGPIKFKAKAEGAIRAAELANARARYFLENGIEHDFASEKEPPVSLDGMKSIINQRGKEIYTIIKAQNPEMSDEDALRAAQVQVQQQFGLAQ